MDNQIKRVDEIIQRHYPKLSSNERQRLAQKILEYIVQGMSEGYTFALQKEVDDGTIVKVLRILTTNHD